MDFNKSKILLEKINGLFKSMSMDPDNIASIEKDLMVNYVRQFYDAVKFEEAPSNHPLEQKAPIAPPTPPPAPVQTRYEPEPIKPVEPEPVRYIEPTPEPVKQVYEEQKVERPKPRIIQVPPSLMINETYQDKPTPTPPPAPTREPQPAESLPYHNGEMDSLFQQKEAAELSQKLGELPIRDLHKSMGINERELTKQELFGGNEADFKLTLDTLNGFSSYEEAKRYLSAHTARKYNWTNDNLVKKAKVFLRLVARKYK